MRILNRRQLPFYKRYDVYERFERAVLPAPPKCEMFLAQTLKNCCPTELQRLSPAVIIVGSETMRMMCMYCVYNILAENEILHSLFVLGPSRTWYQISVGSWYVLPLAGVLRRYVIIRRSNNLFASVVLVRSTDYLSR